MSANVSEKKMGGLTTRVVDVLEDGVQPSLAVVICHGFGAPGTDLVPLVNEFLGRSEKLRTSARFYFPEGPLDLSSAGMWGARAWWMIDMEALNRAMMDGGFRARSRDERPEGLEEARAMLLKLVDEVKEETGLATSRVALGGFSQGAMLSTDVAMQLEDNPAGLILWSGTLLNEGEWRKLGPRRKGLKVLQTHGRQDALLPYDWAEGLRDMLREVGMEVDFHAFDGPHTVPEVGIERAVALLEGA